MQGDITRLLGAVAAGSDEAVSALYELTYDELRRIARRELGRRGGVRGRTMDTGALVHEAYLKLFEGEAAELADRGHFYAIAARAMRHILVDHYRRRHADKRGGGALHVAFDDHEHELSEEQRAELILAVDSALERLGRLDERLVRVVECLYFAGMTQEETAEALGVTDRTVRSDWRKARAFLHRELQRGASGS